MSHQISQCGVLGYKILACLTVIFRPSVRLSGAAQAITRSFPTVPWPILPFVPGVMPENRDVSASSTE